MDAEEGRDHFARHPPADAPELEERRAVDELVENSAGGPADGEQSRSDAEQGHPPFGRNLVRHPRVHAELGHKVRAHTGRLEQDALLEVFEQLGNEVVVCVDQVPDADSGAVPLVLERGQQVCECAPVLRARPSAPQELTDDVAEERDGACRGLAAAGDVDADLEHELLG